MDPRTWQSLRNALSFCTVFLLCLLHVAVPVVLQLTSGTPSHAAGVGLELLWRTTAVCLLLFVFYLYQRVLYDVLRRKIHRGITWSILVLSPVVLFGAESVYHSLPPVRARHILGTAELAALPESATDITIYTWWTPMSREEYLRFRATPADIESFVAQSPILRHAERRDYSSTRMRLLNQNRTARTPGYGVSRHEYVPDHPTAPPWYMQEIKSKARLYRIPRTTYEYRGELIIDEDNDVVCVKLVFS